MSTRPAPIHCPSRLSSLDLVRRGTKITRNRRELSATCASHLYPFDGDENEKDKQIEHKMGLVTELPKLNRLKCANYHLSC